MDLTRRALLTNGNLFSSFKIIFLNELHFFKIIVALGLASEVEKAFVLISTRSNYLFYIASIYNMTSISYGRVFCLESQKIDGAEY